MSWVENDMHKMLARRPRQSVQLDPGSMDTLPCGELKGPFNQTFFHILLVFSVH